MFRFSDVASGLAFTAGHGNGAMALNGQAGLAMSSDHGRDGGVNPLLALASGGEFASVDLPLARNTAVPLGVTRQQRDHDWNPFQTDMERYAYQGIRPFEADAMNLRITHRASRNLTWSAGPMPGSASATPCSACSRASRPTSATARPARRRPCRLARRRQRLQPRRLGHAGADPFRAAEQGFVTQGDGVISSAFAVSATRQGVFGRRDAMRLSVAQPLHIESGRLAYRIVEVLDRTTGELGVADQRFDLERRSADADRRGALRHADPLRRRRDRPVRPRPSSRPDGNLKLTNSQ